MSSLRAEIGGFLGGISAISHILNLEPPIPLEKRVALPMYLDNSALISRIEQGKYNGLNGALRTDYHLLQTIIHAISQRITKRFDPRFFGSEKEQIMGGTLGSSNLIIPHDILDCENLLIT